MISYIAAPPRAEDPERIGRDLVMMFNSTGQQRDFVMPDCGRGMRWNLFVDTAADAPRDIFPERDGALPATGSVFNLPQHSMKVLVSQTM